MNESLIHYAVEVASGITVAVLLGIVGFFQGIRRERHRVSKAPFVFVNRLDELIHRAIREGPDMANLNGRAIVAARNSLAGSLSSISSHLNSQIDRLADELGEATLTNNKLSFQNARSSTVGQHLTSGQEAYETIQVLARVWPSKRSEIIFAVRRLLAELGLHFDPIDERPFENLSDDNYGPPGGSRSSNLKLR